MRQTPADGRPQISAAASAPCTLRTGAPGSRAALLSCSPVSQGHRYLLHADRHSQSCVGAPVGPGCHQPRLSLDFCSRASAVTAHRNTSLCILCISLLRVTAGSAAVPCSVLQTRSSQGFREKELVLGFLLDSEGHYKSSSKRGGRSLVTHTGEDREMEPEWPGPVQVKCQQPQGVTLKSLLKGFGRNLWHLDLQAPESIPAVCEDVRVGSAICPLHCPSRGHVPFPATLWLSLLPAVSRLCWSRFPAGSGRGACFRGLTAFRVPSLEKRPLRPLPTGLSVLSSLSGRSPLPSPGTSPRFPSLRGSSFRSPGYDL